jgi:agmatinase
VLDPAFAPAVSTPEPGGLSTLDLLRILRGLRGLNLRGFDVVEVVPPFDTGITAFAAARAIYELLGILL